MEKQVFLLIMLAGYAAAAAGEDPPAAPGMYDLGPASPLVAAANLFAPERAALALMEAAMQQAEARIIATSCSSSAGTYGVFLYSDGSVNNPNYNFVIVDSPASTFTLTATLGTADSFRGQTMVIKQDGAGALNKVALSGYVANVSYNAKGTIMTLESATNVMGVNGRFDAYQGKVMKAFYYNADPQTGLPYIFDWGLQSLSKLGFPAQKYWQRSKVLRDDSLQGRTAFVKDRLVGPTPCRIVVDTADYNNQDFFYQYGSMTVSTVPPSPAYVFNF